MNWTVLLILLAAVTLPSQGFFSDEVKQLNRTIPSFIHTSCSLNLRIATFGAQRTPAQIKNEDTSNWFEKLEKQYTWNPLNLKDPGNVKNAGELLSWIAGIAVPLAFSAIAQAGAVSPGLGVISWMFGFYGAYKDNKEKQELQRKINKALTQITQKVDEKMAEMKLYVDSTTMALEKGLNKNEFQQMYGLLADCISMDEEKPRQQCFVDRCSYVKAGFYKFAVNYDELIDKTKNISALFDSLSGLDIKRTHVNIPMFLTYVNRLLIPCETIRIMELTAKKHNSIDPRSDSFDLDAEKNNWRLDDKIISYLTNATALLKYSYTFGYRKMADSTVIEDYGLLGSNTWPATVQCRLRMNNFDSDTCDYQTEIPWKEWKKKVTEKFHNDEEMAVKDHCVAINKNRSAETTTAKFSRINNHFVHLEKMERSWKEITLVSELKTKLEDLYKGPKIYRGPKLKQD